ncbi:MAG: hypothetical protein ACRDZM_10480 [Acidimicrobiia bacterium]
MTEGRASRHALAIQQLEVSRCTALPRSAGSPTSPTPLAEVLPDVRIEPLPGQAHEGMTTAPEMYAEAVCPSLLS